MYLQKHTANHIPPTSTSAKQIQDQQTRSIPQPTASLRRQRTRCCQGLALTDQWSQLHPRLRCRLLSLSLSLKNLNLSQSQSLKSRILSRNLSLSQRLSRRKNRKSRRT